MNTREFFIRQFRAERPKFLNVIRALPTGRLDYKPHERNSAAGDIAWFLVLELRGLVEMINTGEMHWKQLPNPGSTEAIAAEYEKAADAMEKALASTDDARWEANGSMFAGETYNTGPMQIGAGVLMNRMPVSVVHPIDLLDAAYRDEERLDR